MRKYFRNPLVSCRGAAEAIQRQGYKYLRHLVFRVLSADVRYGLSSRKNRGQDVQQQRKARTLPIPNGEDSLCFKDSDRIQRQVTLAVIRSEERRVGKECRCRWSWY